MAGVIEQYVAALRRDLSFDPALARRMGEEVEAPAGGQGHRDRDWRLGLPG